MTLMRLIAFPRMPRTLVWLTSLWVFLALLSLDGMAKEASGKQGKSAERCGGPCASGGRGPEGRGHGGRHPLRKFDEDKDGFLSFEEFSKSPRLERLNEVKKRKLFNYLDLDKDGKLSKNELTGGKHRGSFAIQFKKYDLDQSGGLSFEEFSQIPWVARIPEERRKKLFQKIDLKKDGSVSAKEVRQAWATRCQRGHRQCCPDKRKKHQPFHRGASDKR